MKSPEVEIFCLCMDAKESGGALNITQSFYKIQVTQFPVTIPRIMLVARLRFEVDQEGQHRYEIISADLDNRAAGPVMKGMATVTAQTGDVHAWTDVVVAMQNIELRRKGDVRFDLSIDGQHLASSWLYVTGV